MRECERDLSFSHSVLDPMLFDLFDPNIRYSPSTTELNGKQLQGFAYERPFDQHYVNYVLETLLSVVKFGGQGFSKVARTTPINRSLYGTLLQRLQTGKPQPLISVHIRPQGRHKQSAQHSLMQHTWILSYPNC